VCTLATDDVDHAADLAVPAFANHYPQLGQNRIATAWRHSCDLHFREGGHALFKLYASAKCLDVSRAQISNDYHDILLGDLGTEGA